MDGRNEYRDFPAYCMDYGKVDGYFRVSRVTDKKSRIAFDRNFLSLYRQKIESIPEGTHTVIISSEHFSSRMKSPSEISRAKELLLTDFSFVQVVCYLRKQTDKICSGYSTAIKSGSTLSFDEYFDRYVYRPPPTVSSRDKFSRDEYDCKLLLWETALGHENMCVRLYDKSRLSGGILLSDFCGILDKTLFDSLNIPIDIQNEALSAAGCELMRRVNYLFPERFRRGRVEGVRAFIMRKIAVLVQGAPVRLTIDQAQLIDQRYKESNARTCEMYFPDRSTLF